MSGGAPLVTVVETTDLRKAHNPPLLGRLYRPRFGCLFRQRQMTTAAMVIVEKRSEMASQTGLVENDDVVV